MLTHITDADPAGAKELHRNLLDAIERAQDTLKADLKDKVPDDFQEARPRMCRFTSPKTPFGKANRPGSLRVNK
jgi:hypothetical protein